MKGRVLWSQPVCRDHSELLHLCKYISVSGFFGAMSASQVSCRARHVNRWRQRHAHTECMPMTKQFADNTEFFSDAFTEIEQQVSLFIYLYVVGVIEA